MSQEATQEGEEGSIPLLMFETQCPTLRYTASAFGGSIPNSISNRRIALLKAHLVQTSCTS